MGRKYNNYAKEFLNGMFHSEARNAYYQNYVKDVDENFMLNQTKAMVRIFQYARSQKGGAKLQSKEKNVVWCIMNQCRFRYCHESFGEEYVLAPHLCDALSHIDNALLSDNFPIPKNAVVYDNAFGPVSHIYFDLSSYSCIAETIRDILMWRFPGSIDFSVAPAKSGVFMHIERAKDGIEISCMLLGVVTYGLNKQGVYPIRFTIDAPYGTKMNEHKIEIDLNETEEINGSQNSEFRENFEVHKLRDIPESMANLCKLIVNGITYICSDSHDRIDYSFQEKIRRPKALSKRDKARGKKAKMVTDTITTVYKVIGPSVAPLPKNEKGEISAPKRRIKGRFFVDEHKRLQPYGPRDNPTYKEITIERYEKGREFINLIERPYLVK